MHVRFVAPGMAWPRVLRWPWARLRVEVLAAALASATAWGCSAEKDTPGDVETPAPVTSAVDFACEASELAPAPLRRLTRFEYVNQIRDLFGDGTFKAIFSDEQKLAELFPPDEQALGFDNQAGNLSLTDLHVYGYLSAASTISDWLLQAPERLDELAGCNVAEADCARRLLTTLARRIQRRTPSETDIDALMSLGEVDASTEAARRDGVSRAIAALLQSPELIYRFERSSEAPGRQFATASTLASRLSFLFWSSAPDPQLLDAADQGMLSNRADVEREARRLAQDPRARRGILHFYFQWLMLTDLDQVEKDQQRFAIWSPSLRKDLSEETSRFLQAVLWDDNARLRTLLTARYTFANARLRDFYGAEIGDPDDQAFSRLDFTEQQQRSGILTHGSILARQARIDQTDPIHRGKFVRERFFCATPVPPPADLVVTPPALNASMTTRERFAAHRESKACSGCHELMDPVGFLFEHYDAIGRYREKEGNLPIDASGYIAASDIEGTLNGAPELASRLLESQLVQSCVVRQWFRFVFGRGETPRDACTLDKLEQNFRDNHGDLRELLIAITQTDPFLYEAPAAAIEESP